MTTCAPKSTKRRGKHGSLAVQEGSIPAASTEIAPETWVKSDACAGQCADRRRFRAGDYVFVASIRESWVLACDEEHGRVTCTGWPEGSVESELCTLEHAASDEERIKMLEDVAMHCREQFRGRAAHHQLSQERQWCCLVEFPNGEERGYIEAGAFALDAARSVALDAARVGGWLEPTRIVIEVEAAHGHEAERIAVECWLEPRVSGWRPAEQLAEQAKVQAP